MTVRQARWNPDTGLVTDYPAKDTESPQLERQGNLFQAAKDKELWQQWVTKTQEKER
jgi:hypothetical protein